MKETSGDGETDKQAGRAVSRLEDFCFLFFLPHHVWLVREIRRELKEVEESQRVYVSYIKTTRENMFHLKTRRQAHDLRNGEEKEKVTPQTR